MTWNFNSGGDDDFFDFGDDPFEGDGFDGFGMLPPCDKLFEIDQRPGENCDNSTVEVPEVRNEDPLFQRLVHIF